MKGRKLVAAAMVALAACAMPVVAEPRTQELRLCFICSEIKVGPVVISTCLICVDF